MLFVILLTVQILICVTMGGLILIQRSEGGALGMGGGPSGFMSARGAGNLLTKLTAIFAVLFFANSIGLTIVGNMQNHARSAVDQVDTSHLPATSNSLLPAAPASAAAPSSAAPSLNDLPLANSAPAAPVNQLPTTVLPQASGKPTVSNTKPMALPAPLNLPSSSSASAKPHSNIFDTAPAASSATKPATTSPAPAPTSQP